MLDSAELANILDGGMKEADNFTDAHNNFAGALNNYLKKNTELEGVYVGVTPGGSTDPFSGAVTWKCSECEVAGSEIGKGAKNGGREGWCESMKNELSKKLKFKGADSSGNVMIGEVKILVLNLDINMSGDEKTRKDAMKKTAKGIVKAIRESFANPATINATTSAGTGTVTFGAVK